MLLKAPEVRVDRLDDVERPAPIDRDVGREALQDPALVGQRGGGETEREQDDPDRGRDGASEVA